MGQNGLSQFCRACASHKMWQRVCTSPQGRRILHSFRKAVVPRFPCACHGFRRAYAFCALCPGFHQADLSPMTPIPESICRFLHASHVLSLAVGDADGMLWAASCFYVFDEAEGRLIVMSSASTLHGRMMLVRPDIAGTIAGQPAQVADIRGVQFRAHASRLTGDSGREAAFARYAQRHPMARQIPADLWSLSLQQLKFTDNQIAFGHKTHWQRDDGEGCARRGRPK